MSSREEIKSFLRSGLVERGFSGRGNRLRFRGSELLWLIDLEFVPRTERVGLTVGVCPEVLARQGWPDRANNCPIIADPVAGSDALFGHSSSDAWLALDSQSRLSAEGRADELRVLADAIAETAKRISSLTDLRSAAARGELVQFVRRDARALLEEDGDLPD